MVSPGTRSISICEAKYFERLVIYRLLILLYCSQLHHIVNFGIRKLLIHDNKDLSLHKSATLPTAKN